MIKIKDKIKHDIKIFKLTVDARRQYHKYTATMNEIFKLDSARYYELHSELSERKA
jgi:hypothetical protein